MIDPHAATARLWYRSPGRLVVAFIAACAMSVLVALTASTWLHQFDLRIYFDAIAWWHRGNDVYSYSQPDALMGSLGFTYPPFAAVVLWPIGWMTFPALQIVMLALIVVCGAACVALVIARTALIRGRSLAAAVLVATPLAFTLEPWRQNLSLGQINLVLAALITVDLLRVSVHRPRWTGMGIGLAMALKITPGVFLLPLLATRRWRALAVAVGTAAVATSLAALVLPSASWRFFTDYLWDTARVGDVSNIQNQSVRGWISRVIPDQLVQAILWAVVSVVVVLLALGAVVRTEARSAPVATLAVTGLAGILVAPVSWMHHAVWVMPALACLVQRFLEIRRTTGQPADRRLVLALVISGVIVWCLHPGTYLSPDTDYASAGLGIRLLSGLPVLWCLVFLVVARLRPELLAARPAATSGAGTR
ncbi:glycosyltransferase 87 family protein [Nakamurella sp. A5-74]|uniref:Glycosyltransferase 87 family protein n=1 Tax=Nakamurella sp. A5-74 TaxID=3158264 RepID=A0AAU8DM51_9ACTN